MGFGSFIGNRKAVDRLVRKLREGRFPHALIFSGPEGLGKHTLALMIAKALNCTGVGVPAIAQSKRLPAQRKRDSAQPEEEAVYQSGLAGRSASPTGRSIDRNPDAEKDAEVGEFCDKCSNCRKINSGSHPDVMTISVEDEATQIKIGQVRRLLEMLDLKPLEGRNNVFIIDPADLLNAEAANALLKGLEEPPANTFFILITVNVHELLLTVRSRGQVYNFTPLTLNEIRQYGITDELVIRWSQGSIGRARKLDMPQLKSEREVVLDFLEIALTAPEDHFQELLGVSAELGRAKQEFEGRMAFLTMFIADLLYIKEDLPDKVVNIDFQSRLARLATPTTVGQLIRMADFLRTIESGLKSNVNRQIMADMLAVSANEILHGLS